VEVGVLRVEGVRSGYGSVPVVHGVDLSVEPGELVLVLGPNGAGKTTLLRTIGGFIRPNAGVIRLDGESVGGVRPERLARRGLRLVLEGHRIFPELTVSDNLRLGQLTLGDRAGYPERLDAVAEMFPFLRERLGQYARDLSGGQQQLLALAQAFIGRPRVLMCDEPSLGVALGLVPTILQFLRGLADRGVAVVVVEQLPEQALDVADRVVILRQGVVVSEGESSDYRDEVKLQSIFLGEVDA
jgi:branched-chain amino acid transport system ATP-binding protein